MTISNSHFFFQQKFGIIWLFLLLFPLTAFYLGAGLLVLLIHVLSWLVLLDTQEFPV